MKELLIAEFSTNNSLIPSRQLFTYLNLFVELLCFMQTNNQIISNINVTICFSEHHKPLDMLYRPHFKVPHFPIVYLFECLGFDLNTSPPGKPSYSPDESVTLWERGGERSQTSSCLPSHTSLPWSINLHPSLQKHPMSSYSSSAVRVETLQCTRFFHMDP